MNKAIKAEVRAYLRKIRKALPGSFNTKQAVASTLKSQIENYIEDNPDATIDDVIERFGTPETIANEFDVTEFSAEIKKYKLKVLVLSIVSILILSVCIILTVALVEAFNESSFTITDDFDSENDRYNNEVDS
ncbi:MAG: hypothetical protein IJD79_04495 [Clostridia bacterium]|nr:hypothetical protein [Clostridia bacterium]